MLEHAYGGRRREAHLGEEPVTGHRWMSDPTLTLQDNGPIDYESRMRERQEHSLGGHDIVDDEDVEHQNAQIIRLISALGNRDSGRRAILAAMDAKQGVSSNQEIDDLMSGTAERRLQVPAYLRNVLSDIGFGDAIASLNLFEVVGGAELLLLAGEERALVRGGAIEDCPGFS